MENVYVKCIEQILKVEPPVEEARALIMRVVKQELQYSDKLTDAQRSKAIELLSFVQFPLKIKRDSRGLRYQGNRPHRRYRYPEGQRYYQVK